MRQEGDRWRRPRPDRQRRHRYDSPGPGQQVRRPPPRRGGRALRQAERGGRGPAVALAEDIASSFAEFEGVARGNPHIRAGVAASLSLVKAPFDGKYSVTSSRHVYEAETGYTVWFTVSGSHDLVAVRTGRHGSNGGGGSGVGCRPRRPGGGGHGDRHTDANDPMQLGRVKLNFPWLSDSYVTEHWALGTVQLCVV